MFTGLVEEIGVVVAIQKTEVDARLSVETNIVYQDVTMGASIALNGCCLTVVKINSNQLSFDAGSETLGRTNLDKLVVGDHVNLERALKAGDRLGGHYVTGHIDGCGTISEIRKEGEWSHLRFSAPKALCLQMASKGSVAVDGISLTLVNVGEDWFTVAIVPHTLAMTTLGRRVVGSSVNLETDVLAKYVETQLRGFVLRGTQVN